MAKEKLEDELNERKRAAEGIEFVSDINSLLKGALSIWQLYNRLEGAFALTEFQN